MSVNILECFQAWNFITKKHIIVMKKYEFSEIQLLPCHLIYCITFHFNHLITTISGIGLKSMSANTNKLPLNFFEMHSSKCLHVVFFQVTQNSSYCMSFLQTARMDCWRKRRRQNRGAIKTMLCSSLKEQPCWLNIPLSCFSKDGSFGAKCGKQVIPFWNGHFLLVQH